MTDYIERKDAINALAISQDFSGINAEKLNNLLSNIPSADVVERKRGEWVYEFGKGAHCSICGKGCVWNFNYCPNCGADMRGNDK